MVLLYIQWFHLYWMILVYPFMLHLSILGMFWFVSVGYTFFKLSLMLSLKFGCDNHVSIGSLI
jgi:hypothetical protein